MQQASLLFKNYAVQKTTAKTPQGELIDQFRHEINIERIKTKYKPMTFMAVKMKLYAIMNNTQALHEYLSECKDYKNRNGSFSKRFFGGLKACKEKAEIL